MSEQIGRTHKFGSFHLVPAERLLLRAGTPVALTAKVFDLLLTLVEHGGRLVTKEELMERVWPGQFVEENNLTVNMSALRKALGESAAMRYIETVPKRGYRFAAGVRTSSDEAGEAGSPGGNGFAANSAVRSEPTNALAVLPFVNASADETVEYLSDGITETLINKLSRLTGLRVMSRATVFHYRGQAADARDAARQLNVQFVLVGRVERRADELMIGAELVRAADGSHVWGERYRRPTADIFAIEDDIAGEIARKLRLEFAGGAPERFLRRGTQSVEAYQLYLKGRHHINKKLGSEALPAIEYFKRAVAVDPAYALAYAGLAETLVLVSFVASLREVGAAAQAAATRALELDADLPEAQTACALVNRYVNWDWLSAERAFRRAIELNPNYAQARQWYSWHLTGMKRSAEALAQLREAQAVDPLSIMIDLEIMLCLYFHRRFAEASERARSVLEHSPHDGRAYMILGVVYEAQGLYTAAIAAYEKATELIPSNALLYSALIARLHALTGRTDEARQQLHELDEMRKQVYVSPCYPALIHDALGERERALDLLEEAFSLRDYWMTWMKVWPQLDSFRREPRFQDLLRRAGLAAPHDNMQEQEAEAR